jgi:hypothetical protein
VDCAGGGPGLCLCAFDPAGAPRGPETELDAPSLLPAVALTAQGVIWAVTVEPGGSPSTTAVVARRFTLDGALLGTTVVETGRLRGAQHAATSAAQAPAQMLTSSPRSMRSRIAANSVSARG